MDGSTPDPPMRPALAGKKGLIVGIANGHRIAWGCAKAIRAQGGVLAATWLDERARPFVEPLTRQLGVDITAPLDVELPGQMEAVFAEIERRWGRLDVVLHAIAFAPAADLHGRTSCSSTPATP